MPPSLSQATQLRLRAAEGWVELDLPAEALLELEAIESSERDQLPVLEMFWRVYASWHKWQPALEVAARVVEQFPEAFSGWVERAYALRRVKGGGLAAAFESLLPAWKRFPQEPVIPYNLACYCAQMDRVAEACDWLEQAMAIGNRQVLRTMALDDPDLEPLRKQGLLK